jgi:hypothetical protein
MFERRVTGMAKSAPNPSREVLNPMPGRWLKLGPSGLCDTAAVEALFESEAGWPESLDANAPEHIAKLATSNATPNLFRTV